jgi:transcriptional regulator with XRE-family HTH domain
MNRLPIKFGDKLKMLRLQRGLTITELAAKSGVTQGYISKLESGIKKEPSWKVVQALADALLIPVDDFRDGTKFPLYSIVDHLPKDLRDFVLSQKNIHYIEVAKDCVELDISPEALRLYVQALAKAKALSDNVKK